MTVRELIRQLEMSCKADPDYENAEVMIPDPDFGQLMPVTGFVTSKREFTLYSDDDEEYDEEYEDDDPEDLDHDYELDGIPDEED